MANIDDEVHLVAPKPREERRAVTQREKIEKTRLANRTGGYITYEDPGEHLTASEENAPGFLSNADRFHSDTAGEEKQRRMKILDRENQSRDFHARQNEDRLAQSVEREQTKAAKEQEHLDYIQGNYQKNVSSVAYDPVTLQYGDGLDGQWLKYDDDRAKWRAQKRAENIRNKSTSGVNPVTGESLGGVPIPTEPDMPGELKDRKY